MKVTNPTEQDIHVQIEGVAYSIEAGGSISNVPEDHASHWRSRVHNFIQISQDVSNAPVKEAIVEEVPIQEVPVEEVEEVPAEEVVEEEVEEVEEKPKRKPRTKKSTK